uniref:Elongation of very long chain fatty acids protein n=1 Tax=Blattella germanica TaxID=6973 RepID=A0A8F7CEV0_BLAGE|nr:fatty acid elongase 6 [Blattella germanica]
MSAIHTLVDNHDDVLTNHKESVDSWFLMGGPMPTVTIVVSYLYFVLKFGPQMMASRKPYNLQPLLIAYNFILVLFSLFLSIWPITGGMLAHVFREGCQPTQRAQTELSKTLNSYAWWYLMTKVIELADTLFFVLRKKQQQITFLHVYHHSSLVFFSWCYLKFLPGEQGVVIGFLNSFVHVIMYSYYMVAAMGPKYQKYIWWKKYMTRIQLTQFVIMLVYLVSLVVRDCNLPRILSILMGTNVFFFLCLFLNFYIKTYKSSRSKN